MQDEQNNQQPTIEPQMPVQPVSETLPTPSQPDFELTKKSLPKWPLIIIGGILIATLLMGTYLLGKNMNLTPKPASKTTQVVTNLTPTATLTPDPTANWKTYTVGEIGLTYKVPSYFPELIQQNSNGQTGKQIYISAGKTKVIEGPILLGTTSVDYTAGRGGMFVDLQGYFKQDSKYLAKFVSGKTFEIPTELASEITNKNGLKILIVKGKNFSAEGLPVSGTPGEGHIGALINTNSKTYPGFAIDMTFTDKSTSELFNQILSNFKFTDQTASEICPENGMTLESAEAITQSSECAQLGTLLKTHTCNLSGTGYWWIDFKPNEPKPGCNPACVVDVVNKKAEINWRCTGGLPSSK
jgi:hypothetical protein